MILFYDYFYSSMHCKTIIIIIVFLQAFSSLLPRPPFAILKRPKSLPNARHPGSVLKRKHRGCFWLTYHEPHTWLVGFGWKHCLSKKLLPLRSAQVPIAIGYSFVTINLRNPKGMHWWIASKYLRMTGFRKNAGTERSSRGMEPPTIVCHAQRRI